MSMLHIRYDWRRPVFWAALFLTLIFGSESGSAVNNVAHPVEFVNDISLTPPLITKEIHRYLFESNFTDYSGIIK